MQLNAVKITEMFNIPCQPYEAKSALIALTVGMVFASRLPIPSAPVNDAENHFTTQIKPVLRAWCSEFNECYVLDCPRVIDHARSFWLVRYQAAHPGGNLFVNTGGGFFNSYLGVSRVFSPDDCALLCAHENTVFQLAQRLTQCMNAYLAEQANVV